MFAKNLIPATIGNIIGGSIFVGLTYWYIYVKKTNKTNNFGIKEKKKKLR